MNRQFDPFLYELNFNPTESRSPNKSNSKKSTKTISVLIAPSTNVHSAVRKLCKQNNLNPNLVDILAASIDVEIEKQFQEREMLNTYQSVSSNFSQQSRSKNFKNKFCSSLLQDSLDDISNISTFRNSDFVPDSSIVSPSDEQEYSFRPSIYMKMLDMTYCDKDNKSVSVKNFSENQSHKPIKWSFKKQNNFSNKPIIVKKSKNIFDNLSEHSKALECKNFFQSNQSLEKVAFKPPINSMSKKIIQIKKQVNPQSFTIAQRSLNKLKDHSRSPCSKSKSKSKLIKPINQTSNKHTIKQKQNILPIYDRGMIYRKKSQQKLFQMKKQQIINEIKPCTFKPKLNINEASRRTKTPQSSFYK